LDRAEARTALQALITRRRSGGYSGATSEADIRQTLIDPLLHDVLGWDTLTVGSYSRERYSRGSGIADSVSLEGGLPVVYWESKRLNVIPSVEDLRKAGKFYAEGDEQALRYARRNTDMPQDQRWTVLTNFDRLRLFEATTEERVFAFESPGEMLDRLDDLLLLSREAVVDGSLRREVSRRKKPDIDDEFRDVLNSWRLKLAQDIYDQNTAALTKEDGTPDLSVLQSAVQRLLDRLIILQFASDVDALGASDPLRELLQLTKASADPRPLVPRPSLRDSLLGVFQRFDGYYNTTLFSPGHVVEGLVVSDEALRTLIDSVASQSFRRLDADILGATYETYLGHQLRLNDGKVLLELRPELRRQGGVYYTPRHVVDAIVKRTLTPLLDAAESIEEVDAIRVVDPACGSGSFLIRAFDAFADWYEAENERRKARAVGQQATIADHIENEPIAHYGKRVLENNIFGVDLDPEAAEIATVNLIMQALRRGRIGLDLGRLPLILGQNIKVGNSLVPGLGTAPTEVLEKLETLGPKLRELRDARQGVRASADTAVERERLTAEEARATTERNALIGLLSNHVPEVASRRPFFWQLEFPEVFDPDAPPGRRGFDVVIGNPPWIGFFGANKDRPYLGSAYRTAIGRFDIYVPFVEVALGLLKANGRLGFITPSNFFLRDYGIELRNMVRDEYTLDQVIDFGHQQLFRGATNYPAILIVANTQPAEDHEVLYLRSSYDGAAGRRHRQSALAEDGWVFLTAGESRMVEHMRGRTEVTLADVCKDVDGDSGLAEGVITGQNNVFLLDEATIAKQAIEPGILRKAVKGEDVSRWSVPQPIKRFLLYPYTGDEAIEEETLKATYPNAHRWLEFYRNRRSKIGGLAGREYFDKSPKDWYELWNERRDGLLSVAKLLTPEVNDRPEFALADADVAFTNSVTSATPSADSGVCREYLAGVLNSRLLAVFHARHSVPKANGFLIYTPAFLKDLPIIKPNMEDEGERHLHDTMVGYVHQLIAVSEARRNVVLDFQHYVRDMPLGDATLHSLLNKYPATARETLNLFGGKLLRVAIRRDGGSLILSGVVRVAGVAYGRGEAETIDLLKITVPEPAATFLQRYVPVARNWARGQRGVPRNLAARAGDFLMPTLDDAVMQGVLDAYEPVLEEAARLDAEYADLERGVDEAVVALYGLDAEMRDALAQAYLPAEVIGNPQDDIALDDAVEADAEFDAIEANSQPFVEVGPIAPRNKRTAGGGSDQ
jgi:hypothetical protein